jgi:hypothetical protein
LIDWKWKNITTDVGYDRSHPYDAILPEPYASELRVLYPGIVARMRGHHHDFPFHIHKYFNHMASSQAANLNLFLPILIHPNIDAILGELIPQFGRLATDQLDHGWRIEFWDEPFGVLHDKKKVSGTDSDLAIAYYDRDGKLCLWLIEHKLTESEFTTCGGFRSERRKNHPEYDCTRSFLEILNKKELCFYHGSCKYRYWVITEANRDFFPNHIQFVGCPFRDGLNQLWRNQLLGLGVEQDTRQPYQYVHFSVVKHPRNTYLDGSLKRYQALIDFNPRFTLLTSADVLHAAQLHADPTLDDWVNWYRKLYDV